jgi:hypothetical protein
MVFRLHPVSLNRAFRFKSRSVCAYMELILDYRTMRHASIMVSPAGFSARYSNLQLLCEVRRSYRGAGEESGIMGHGIASQKS